MLNDRIRSWTSFNSVFLRTVRLPLLLLACLAGTLSSCTYVERAREMTDSSTAAAEQSVLDTLVDANIERQRLRRLRCLDPLLSPMTIKRAAADSRLGQPWLEELQRDCPELSTLAAN